MAKAQAAGETGWGVFGVELFVLTDGSILFNEVSPRPHDTGMVTMASQRLSEFALHARAILGLPITPKHVALTIPAGSVAASHAIVVAGDGEVEFTDVPLLWPNPARTCAFLPSPKCMATAAWPWHWPSASPKPTPVPRPASWPMR